MDHPDLTVGWFDVPVNSYGIILYDYSIGLELVKSMKVQTRHLATLDRCEYIFKEWIYSLSLRRTETL